MLRTTRDDKRSKALIVRPRGTQRILRPAEASRNPASRLAGGSRSALSIGGGGGGRTFGGGGAAAVAAALASTAMPAAQGPDIFPTLPPIPPATQPIGPDNIPIPPETPPIGTDIPIPPPTESLLPGLLPYLPGAGDVSALDEARRRRMMEQGY